MLAALSSIRTFLFASKQRKELLNILPNQSFLPQKQDRPTFVVSSIPLQSSKNVMLIWATFTNGELQGELKVVNDCGRPYAEIHYAKAIEMSFSFIERNDLRNSLIYYGHRGLEKYLKGVNKTKDRELWMKLCRLQIQGHQLQATLKYDKPIEKNFKEQMKRIFGDL